MAEPAKKLYIAREDDVTGLMAHWNEARDGYPRAVLLTAPLGGGKRALVNEVCRQAVAEEDDILLWRVSLADEEDGLQTLLRIYAGLYQALHRVPVLRGKVEMALNSQIPNQPRRVQGWYQAFIEGLKKGAPKKGDEKFQVILPRDNPLIGLVEITCGIARKFPVILDLQNLHHTQSLAVHAMLESLIDEVFSSEEDTRLLVLMSLDQLNEANRRWFSMPLQEMIERRSEDLVHHEMAAWTSEEVDRYLASKDLESNSAEIARIAGGRPGYIAELIEWLKTEDRLGSDLSTLQMGDICDVSPDEDELEDDEDDDDTPAENKRPRAGVEHAERVAHISALIGLSFPSGLVADLAGLNRESIDDLLDATEDIYKELQFSKPLNSWIYQFHKALLRESVLSRHTSEEDQKLAQQVGAFMERFMAPRGYPFLIKTLRMYGMHGPDSRAALLRSMALSADQPQVWAMVHDLLNYFDENDWPKPMRRTVYMNLVDRMVQTGDLKQTENLWNQAMKWATESDERRLQGWLLFAGSRLDHRRQDLYRARDRANDALKIFAALDDKLKQGELHAHLAKIELADGNPNAALDQAAKAEAIAPIPPMQAHAALIRGQVSRQARKFDDACQHFQKANELAGRAGVAQLALEAGLALGESLFLKKDHGKSADVLRQVAQISVALRNPASERTASALLAQSQAALKNFEAALKHQTRTLELTRQLKFNRLEAVDLYNMALFNLMLRRPTEAVSLLQQARKVADATDANFQKELLFNLGSALREIGENGKAEEAWVASLGPATAAKDWRKVMGANEQLSKLYGELGQQPKAVQHLKAALEAAERGSFREDHKRLRKALNSLRR